MARILITGGAGFIGSHLAEHHLKKGDSVWVLDNLLTGKEENIAECLQNPAFKFSHKDLILDEISDAIEWAESIYQMAAIVGYHVVLKRPLDTLSLNIRICENVFGAVAKLNPKARILIASSSEVYGNHHGGPLSEELPVYFTSRGKTQRNYALGKFVNEMLGLSYVEEKGLFTVIARIFNTSGSRQPSYEKSSYVIPNFIERALNNRPITVYGDGSQTRSFCSVHDTVKMLDLYLNHTQTTGEVLNIGNDEEISIADLAKLICKRAKSKSEIVYVPYEEAYGQKFYDTMRRRPNLEKMRKILHYTPQFSIEKLVDEMIHYQKNTAKI